MILDDFQRKQITLYDYWALKIIERLMLSLFKSTYVNEGCL